jgi:hypothetical protein
MFHFSVPRVDDNPDSPLPHHREGIAHRRSQSTITMAKSIWAAKTAVNNWYQNEKIAA